MQLLLKDTRDHNDEEHNFGFADEHVDSHMFRAKSGVAWVPITAFAGTMARAVLGLLWRRLSFLFEVSEFRYISDFFFVRCWQFACT